MSESLLRRCLAEALGTFILCVFGLGAVHAAVLLDALSGLWQVASVWGVGVALAIVVTGPVSGAHLNPAITVAFAAFRGFPAREVPAYVLAQLSGAFVAAAILFALYAGPIAMFEHTFDLERGEPRSELVAMIYGEYSPNPAMFGASDRQAVSHAQACLAELLGTAALALVVFAVSDPRRKDPGPTLYTAATAIGAVVAIIIVVIAPLTQAGLNPARDFGPRLFAFLAGWGEIAIPGPRNMFFTVYILSPTLGAVLGAWVYTKVASPPASLTPPGEQESA